MTTIHSLRQAFDQAQRQMEARRDEFNRADSDNANHGDHMVEIFQVAAQAIQEDDDLAQAMRRAADRLAGLGANGSAQVYARGLYAFAGQFAERQIGLDDLLRYLQGSLNKENASSPSGPTGRGSDVLKALMGGLAEWKAAFNQAPTETGHGDLAGGGVDMSFVIELGSAYLAARSSGGSRAEVVAEAAVTASPLSQVAHQALSGKAAVLAIFESLAA
jgi:hypothetical protein